MPMTERLSWVAQMAECLKLREMAGTMQALAHGTADHDEAIAACPDCRPTRFKGD
ncbi:MAG: hypothetical protein PSY12_13000 [bacterium]|nr:hypothetical protein [bacterium]